MTSKIRHRGWVWRTTPSASAPERQTTTRYPALSRYARTTSHVVWSSSTTRIGAADAGGRRGWVMGFSAGTASPFRAGVLMLTTPHSAKVADKPDGAVPPGFERRERRS